MKVTVFNMNSLLREKYPSYSMRFVNGRWVLMEETEVSFRWLETFSTLAEAKAYIEKEVA